MSWKIFKLNPEDRLRFRTQDNEEVEIHIKKVDPSGTLIAVHTSQFVHKFRQPYFSRFPGKYPRVRKPSRF